MKKRGNRRTLGPEEYAPLVEQSPAMIRRWDRALECDYGNRRWLYFRGAPAKQGPDKSWEHGVHPDDARRCGEVMRASAGKGEPFELEYRLLRFDGVFCLIRELWVPLAGRGGGYVSTAFEVAGKTLPGETGPAAPREFLETCAGCRKILDEGAWRALEHYFEKHTPFRFSHSICPECRQRLYKSGKK
ncbi:MAG: PAS domain-containing protein [Endomicrobiales bacterium]